MGGGKSNQDCLYGGWPTLSNIRGLRGFIGLTGYYCRFVRDYGKIAAPLTALLRKDQFGWSEDTEKAFDHLKKAMITTSVLALPNFSIPFVLECDAFGKGIGAVLMQDGRPIAFFSKALLGRNLALSTYEKEMIAIIQAISKWRPYLLGRKFTILTDDKSLKFFLDQRVAIVVADALSRQDHEAHIHALSIPRLALWEDFRTKVATNEELCKILTHLVEDPTTLHVYSSHDGVLCYKNRLALPSLQV
ncbi:hypothetical protein HHK36_026118 [Tetracentron sinense]|uniref:Reverse transcriptase/retrotransposon-derived protein RNase H-like domain-containing protein n=1 Tax=Tetracentron sinense TaxID=13715 RepID=A0A834YMV2_TETSI|nr:hypothetical protein HHK36_026118 [Tetracentron sinense]